MEGLRGADTQGNELLLQEEGRTGAGRSETTEAASAGKQRDGEHRLTLPAPPRLQKGPVARVTSSGT